MPMLPRASARAANTMNRSEVERGVATASESTAFMVFISLTAASGFAPATASRNVSADSVLTGPEAPRGLGGDDGNRFAGSIGIRKRSAREYGDTHNSEIAGSDDVEPEERNQVLSRRRRVVFDLEGALGDPAVEG